jgi:hypothetical protein
MTQEYDATPAFFSSPSLISFLFFSSPSFLHGQLSSF